MWENIKNYLSVMKIENEENIKYDLILKSFCSIHSMN